MEANNNDNMLIYQSADGKIKIDVRFEKETVWLSLDQMAALFGREKSTISRHIKNVFEEGELSAPSVVANYATTAADGKTYHVDYYNLDVIISVGYRVKSQQGTQFRIWATQRLREYIIKGFALNDERFKTGSSYNYFKELLERIRDIRSSEKVFYRQVLDLFATSIDYNGQSEEARRFFSTVQNKMHYAIHHQTASELIVNRVDAQKDFMGLTTFKGELPTITEAKTAKNYLTEKELRGLNQLVSGYLDFAERQAERENTMTMIDWINHVDSILKATGEDVLENAGKVSHSQMEKKVEEEYKKYSQYTLTPVEKDYIEELKSIENIAKRGGR